MPESLLVGFEFTTVHVEFDLELDSLNLVGSKALDVATQVFHDRLLDGHG